MKVRPIVTCGALLAVFIQSSPAEEWLRFRGPNGSGISESVNVPLEWSETKNLKWKLKLPGPGSSSPIVVGDRVFVTCYSGYGTGGDDESIQNLKRHLVCADRVKGKLLWARSVDAVQPEDRYRGFITHHGYASHTPVSDGKRVIAFFGKSGVVAYDLLGKKLWQKSVGTGSGPSGWGTGASPIVYKNLVIVNASAESQALYAFDAQTGKQVWKAEAGGLRSSWSTPVIASTKEGKKELVIAVPNEVWGLNPDNGKLLWYAGAKYGSIICPSVVTDQNVVYAIGGRGRGGGSLIAIRTGGRGDVTKTHVLWEGRDGSPVPTPVLYKNRLYCFTDSGFVFCTDAKTGKRIYKERLLRGGAGGNRSTYASMIAANGKLYAVSRFSGTFVIAPGDQFKKTAVNTFSEDDSAFHGTPAISEGLLFLRSDRFLYCVHAEKK